MRKEIYNIPLDSITSDEARERISKLLKSYDPNYWLMKHRKQKMSKLLKNMQDDNTNSQRLC